MVDCTQSDALHLHPSREQWIICTGTSHKLFVRLFTAVFFFNRIMTCTGYPPKLLSQPVHSGFLIPFLFSFPRALMLLDIKEEPCWDSARFQNSGSGETVHEKTTTSKQTTTSLCSLDCEAHRFVIRLGTVITSCEISDTRQLIRTTCTRVLK